MTRPYWAKEPLEAVSKPGTGLQRLVCRLRGHDLAGFWAECECRRCGKVWKCLS